MAFGKHTRYNDVRRDMALFSLGSTRSQTTSVMADHHPPWTAYIGSNNVGHMACHHRLWTAYTVGRYRVWHVIIALGQQTRSDDLGSGMRAWPLDNTHG